MITRELRVANINVEGVSLDNFYPCLCSGFSYDVKHCEWNKHSWTVNFFVRSATNSTVKVFFEVKCGNRTIAKCIASYNRYTGKELTIHFLDNKLSGKWDKRKRRDVCDFVKHIILIFGKVAYLEKTKKKLSIVGVASQTNANTIEKNSVSLDSKNNPYVPNSRNNISKTYKSSAKNKPKRYITESWVCAGKYVKGKYIESRICHRNPNLLANSRICYS